MKFLIINGPNLNLLGQREPGIYGEENYTALCGRLRAFASAHQSTAECFQSNHEGAIIDAIHAAQGNYDTIAMPSWTRSRRSGSPASRSTSPTSISGKSFGTGP